MRYAARMADDLDALMALAQAGDADAYAAVVRGVEHVVRATLLTATADPALADDLAADALVHAWDRRDQYRPGTSPRAWILAIARTRLIDHQRRVVRRERHLAEIIRTELLRHRPAEDDPNLEPRRRALEHCVASLEDPERHLISLVYAEGLDSAGAGDALNLRPETCRQRLCRLHRRLRSCVERRLAGVAS